MQIKRDLFRIESGARENDGTKIDPEGQVVQHIYQGTAPVGFGSGIDSVVEGGPSVGSVPIEIVATSNAQAVARSVSTLCGNCRWFDNNSWRKEIARADAVDASPAEQHSMQQLRAQLLMNMPDADQHPGGDGEYDVEHALSCMGLCPALREFYKAKDKIDEPHVVFPTAGCPQEVCSSDKPHGFFVPKDGDARKASAANFDAVMQRAAGNLGGKIFIDGGKKK